MLLVACVCFYLFATFRFRIVFAAFSCQLDFSFFLCFTLSLDGEFV